jgi:hypothetical protein
MLCGLCLSQFHHKLLQSHCITLLSKSQNGGCDLAAISEFDDPCQCDIARLVGGITTTVPFANDDTQANLDALA